MPGLLQDKVAVVTGASGGLGRAICILYAQEGAKVVCSDLADQGPGSTETVTTHDAITSSGGDAIFIKTDVTDPAAVESLVEQTVAKYGRLDIFVNNAGIAPGERGTVWEMSIERWHRMHSVNSHGVFYGLKYAAAQMVKQEPIKPNGDKGWIINISSILGSVGTFNVADYCASKGLVMNLTKAAALDCAQERIHVNAIGPGYTQTPMLAPLDEPGNVQTKDYIASLHPWGGGGLGQPDSIAKACVFLASDMAQWVTGVYLPVDGGYLAQ